MVTAADREDRTWAILTWLGMLVAGPVAAVVGWIVNRNKAHSLTKRCAPFAVGIWFLTAAVYFPGVIWAYGFSGPKDAFWIAFGTMGTVYLVSIVVGTVVALRARPAPAGGA